MVTTIIIISRANMNVKKILPLLLAAAPVCGGYAAVTSDSLFVYSPGERDGAHVAIVSNEGHRDRFLDPLNKFHVLTSECMRL